MSELVKRLLWHVEQVLGPVSDEPIVNEHDSDKAVLLFNFQAETKRAIDYWYRQGRDDQYATHADRIEALTAENERLREALDAAWKQATTMRNASKLVSPYPDDHTKRSIWVRSLYHEGKRLHELLKPIRAALAGDDT